MTEKEKLEIESDIIQSLLNDSSTQACIWNIYGQISTIKDCLENIYYILNQTLSSLDNSSQSLDIYKGLRNKICDINVKIEKLEDKENETDNRNRSSRWQESCLER